MNIWWRESPIKQLNRLSKIWKIVENNEKISRTFWVDFKKFTWIRKYNQFSTWQFTWRYPRRLFQLPINDHYHTPSQLRSYKCGQTSVETVTHVRRSTKYWKFVKSREIKWTSFNPKLISSKRLHNHRTFKGKTRQWGKKWQ
jgi:hypothetical protein